MKNKLVKILGVTSILIGCTATLSSCDLADKINGWLHPTTTSSSSLVESSTDDSFSASSTSSSSVTTSSSTTSSSTIKVPDDNVIQERNNIKKAQEINKFFYMDRERYTIFDLTDFLFDRGSDTLYSIGITDLSELTLKTASVFNSYGEEEITLNIIGATETYIRGLCTDSSIGQVTLLDLNQGGSTYLNPDYRFLAVENTYIEGNDKFHYGELFQIVDQSALANLSYINKKFDNVVSFDNIVDDRSINGTTCHFVSNFGTVDFNATESVKKSLVRNNKPGLCAPAPGTTDTLFSGDSLYNLTYKFSFNFELLKLDEGKNYLLSLCDYDYFYYSSGALTGFSTEPIIMYSNAVTDYNSLLESCGKVLLPFKFNSNDNYTLTLYFNSVKANNVRSYNNAFLGNACKVYKEHETSSNNQLKDGETVTKYVDFDSHLTQDQIVSQVSSTDMFGKSCSVSVESSDYNPDKVGTYTIVLNATDDDGNTATGTLKVVVKDYTAPVVSLKDEATEVVLEAGSTLNEDELLQKFNISDNVDDLSKLKTTFVYPSGFDKTAPLAYGKKGLFLVVQDTAGNANKFPFKLNTVDTTAPVFSRVDGQDLITVITVGASAVESNTIEKSIIPLFKAIDIVDGNCTITTTSSSLKRGENQVTLKTQDNNGNESTINIVVKVVADLPPVFILSDTLVNATINHPLTLDDLTILVKNQQLKGINARNISVTASAYLNNSNKAGVYPVSYTYDNESNEKGYGSFNIEVVDTGDTPVETTDNAFVKAFKTIFSEDYKTASVVDWLIVVCSIFGGFIVLLALLKIIRKVC